MAGYFKKRRKNQGPNKNEEKVQRAAEARSRESSGGVLGARYPFVKHLKITLQLLSAQQQLLEEKVWDLKPCDPYQFDAACPGRCGSGHFDFSQAVSDAVNKRKSVAEAAALCKEPVYAGSQELCGCQAKCRIELDFLPLPAPTNPAASV